MRAHLGNFGWNKEIRPCGLAFNEALKKMELCAGNCLSCAYALFP